MKTCITLSDNFLIARCVRKQQLTWLISDGERGNDRVFFLETTAHVDHFGILFRRSTYFLAILSEKVVTRKKLSLIFNQLK